MTKPPQSVSTTPLSPQMARQQLSMVFDTLQLRGMTSSGRVKVLAHLAHLLMQAAGAATEERDDDQR